MTSDKVPNSSPGSDSADADETVRTLMNLAGPRDEIPVDLEHRVHGKVLQAWERSVPRPSKLRWTIPVGLAAAVLVALVVADRAPEVPAAPPIGTVAIIIGTPGSGSKAYAVDETIFEGEIVRTGQRDGLSVSLQNGISVRLAGDTTTTFVSNDEIDLSGGKVYVDSGDQVYRNKRISVVTPLGIATDIGTQFTVVAENEKASVAVREGRVDFALEDNTYTAEAGDLMEIGSDGEARIAQIASYDHAWHWVQELAPPFEGYDRSLLDFLKWASRETGKELVFSDNDVRMAAMGTKLFGPVGNFSPSEAVEVVMATTQFVYQIDEHSITISSQE